MILLRSYFIETYDEEGEDEEIEHFGELQVTRAQTNTARVDGEKAFAWVEIESNADGAGRGEGSMYLSREQAQELADYLNKLLSGEEK